MPGRRSDHIAQGETLIVDIPAPAPAGVEAEEIPLDLMYEDEDLAVINKPAGMIVHPGAGADTGTLVAALLHRFGGINGLSNVGGPLRPGIVHRLDKETSGALIDRAKRCSPSQARQGISRPPDRRKLMSPCSTEK